LMVAISFFLVIRRAESRLTDIARERSARTTARCPEGGPL